MGSSLIMFLRALVGIQMQTKTIRLVSTILHLFVGRNVKDVASQDGREQTPELLGDGTRLLVRYD